MAKNSRIQRSVLPGQRITYGPFGEVGYILKNPDHAAMASKRIQSQRLKCREIQFQQYKDFKAKKRENMMINYQNRLDVIKIRSATERVVELGMREADNELERRRNKLRKWLLEDESKYVAEYTQKAQNSLEKRLERELKIVEDIENKAKTSDSSIAQRAYARLAMEKDEEYREKLRLKSLHDLAECRKSQICEKEHAIIQEEEDDRIWEVMNQQRIEAEKEDAKKAKELELRKPIELAEMLDKQIEAQERLRKNQKCLEEIEDIRLKEYNDRRSAEYNKRQQLLKENLILQSKILERQIAENKIKSESNRQQEIMEERILLEDAERKIQREKAAQVDDREKSRAELCIFREAIIEYRNARAEEEAKVDKMIEEIKKQTDRKFLQERREKEMQRRNVAYLCAQQQKQMATQKVAKEAHAQELDANYNKLLGYKNEINKLLDQGRVLYRPMIEDPKTVMLQDEQNEKYLEVLRQRQTSEDQEMMAMMKSARNEMQSKIRQAMDKPLAEIAGTSLHPFYTCIRAQATKKKSS